MKVQPSRVHLGLRPLACCMAAALSCAGTKAISADPLSSPSAPDQPNIYSEGWSEGTRRGSDRIGRLSVVLPSYLRRQHIASPSAAHGITSPHRASTLEVTNCDDAGTGSLRDTVASAASGDTVDLSQLTCSTITLTSAYIQVLQDDLSITGPGAASFTIDGAGAFSQFAHYGNGTFSLDGLTLANGYYAAQQDGGGGACIFSAANVAIQNSVISQCFLQGHVVSGGAIATVGDLALVNTVITGNRANGTAFSSGGAALVLGDLTVQYSTIADNIASNVPPAAGQHSVSGGLHSLGNVLIQNSTISGNQAKNVAALVLEAYNNAPTALIINSTISGNVATNGGLFGGAYTAIPLSLYNSTIAFNSGRGCSGLYAFNAPVTLQSSILADNVSLDLLLHGTATVSGAHNLINNAAVVPPDTIRDCPLLGPLADNGGATLTHMLRSSSPAIDTGSNSMVVADDQRGSGFPRMFGAGVDIGAVEWQGGADERIFHSGFESICDH